MSSAVLSNAASARANRPLSLRPYGLELTHCAPLRLAFHPLIPHLRVRTSVVRQLRLPAVLREQASAAAALAYSHAAPRGAADLGQAERGAPMPVPALAPAPRGWRPWLSHRPRLRLQGRRGGGRACGASRGRALPPTSRARTAAARRLAASGRRSSLRPPRAAHRPPPTPAPRR